jgi:serine/threonine protein kinase
MVISSLREKTLCSEISSSETPLQQSLAEHLLLLCVLVQDGIYTLPCHLSMQARDLITRILKIDPLRRITVPEIRCHPWFQVQLALNLAVPPPEYAQQLKQVLFLRLTYYPS